MVRCLCPKVRLIFPLQCFPFVLFQENGEVKTFTANWDVHTAKRNVLPAEIFTKAIRFYPKTFYVAMALRVELYGYRAGKYLT